jgi:hypothetical protein
MVIKAAAQMLPAPINAISCFDKYLPARDRMRNPARGKAGII